MKGTKSTLAQYWYLYVVDHGFLRCLYSNFFRLPGGLYRCNQPSPAQLKRYQRKFGIKTVFNVRGGDQLNPAWQLEEKACRSLGIKLVDLRILSRSAPYVSDLLAIKNAIAQADYPALVHCKSGADRAGLFSALYRVFRLGESIDCARKELALKYGHVEWAQTGVLDDFLSEFKRYQETQDIGKRFESWIEDGYDRDALKDRQGERKFIHRVGNFLVNRILRRE